MEQRSFTLTYPGGREFRVGVYDLLGVSVDAIVNPANSGLSHGGGLAAQISDEAGPRLDEACRLLVRKHGRIPVTGAVVTPAYDLPYKGIIHAVGPRMGDGDEQAKIERTILNCLRIAEQKGWQSVAFPAISTGLFMVPTRVCAEAFKRAIPAYWEKLESGPVKTIWLCLTITHFDEFDKILRGKGGI